ncbi:MAG: hypothetical protein U0L34_00845 [Paludibacteraceae bacterium]|nr:hypothetical protein [Paludibacteraceae bacterium]
MRKIFTITMLFCLSLAVFAGSKSKANKDTKQFRYELECVANASQGSYLVKVWTYSKKSNVAIEQSKKNAVHGIIFKGFTSKGGCVAQRPFVKQAGGEFEHQDYFDLFFKDGGEYMRFATYMEGTQEIIKVGKEYKVGVIVSVAKDDLRKTLEAAGVIRKLSHGF